MEQGVATGSGRRGVAAVAAPIALRWMRLRRYAFDAAAFLRECLEREVDERAGFAWFAVAFAIGALVYFELPGEPELWPLVAVTASLCALAAICYGNGLPWRALTVAALVLAGLTCAKGRVERLAGPQVERPMTTELSGRVLDGDRRAERRPRIVLDRLVASAIVPAQVPERIRVTISPKQDLPPLGARVTLKARLTPVAGPAIPGGYDPRRAAFFEGIGGSGFVLGRWQLEQPAEDGTAFLIERIRAQIVARILAVEPGEAGAVAAALLVGERSVLSRETNESLRASGLAHILSISGLHMMLISGTAFFLVRALLALSPHLALAYPIRKWAAVAALLVVTAYFALSGGGAATVRSYAMAAIMFTAILLDRPAISMRNLALAAFIVVALEPESVAEPGFQMSFAAVAALIASWEAWRSRRRLRLADDDGAFPGSWLLRAACGAIGAVLLTSLVAGLATAPFSAYHFERVATYSLLGNLFAAPLVSAVIMPFGLLTLVVLPFGFEALPLTVMARGIDFLLRISDWVASLPGAEISAPPISAASLLLMTGGMLWLCLWRLSWRLLGVPAVLLGVLLIPLLAAPADMLVAADGKAVAVRDPVGTLRISGSRAGSYMVEQFLAEEAEPERDAASLRFGIACDRSACLLPGRGGLLVSHVLDPGAFAEDCRRADIVTTPLLAPADCEASLVVDRRALDRFGAHSITWAGTAADPAFTVETERTRSPRPWQAGGGGQAASNISASTR